MRNFFGNNGSKIYALKIQMDKYNPIEILSESNNRIPIGNQYKFNLRVRPDSIGMISDLSTRVAHVSNNELLRNCLVDIIFIVLIKQMDQTMTNLLNYNRFDLLFSMCMHSTMCL